MAGFQVGRSPGLRMKKKMNALDLNDELFFPLEMMFEILSRLTVASLLRCKCVCKRWNEIIKHPKFIQMHMSRSRKQYASHYTRKDETFIILDNSYGLLIEENKISGKYRVRNPSTKQILDVPDPKEKPLFMMIVFLESTSSYKLVYIHVIEGKVGFKVLDFEASDLSWKTVDNSYFFEFGGTREIIYFDLLGRFLYCGVSCFYEDGSSVIEIHCFDVETESLRGIPITVQRSFFSNWEKVEVGKWEDKLVAVMNIVEDDLHVWVLEDPVRVKWAEKKMIIPLPFLKVNPGMKETLAPFWASHEEIWFTKEDGSSVYYRVRSNQAWELQYSTSTPPEKTVSFYGTLVTLKGMEAENEHSSDDVFEEITAELVMLVN